MPSLNYIIIALLFAFSFIMFNIRQKWLLNFDLVVISVVYNMRTKIGDIIFKFIDLVLLLLFLMFCLYLRQNSGLANYLIGYGIAFALGALIKQIIRKPRPNYHNLIKYPNNSFTFPSLHTVFATTLMMAGFSFFGLTSISLFFCFFCFLIMFSRLYLGVHNFSDILGGFLLAIFVYLIYNFVNIF
jgi:undecaprenyl-diphosphatase